MLAAPVSISPLRTLVCGSDHELQDIWQPFQKPFMLTEVKIALLPQLPLDLAQHIDFFQIRKCVRLSSVL